MPLKFVVFLSKIVENFQATDIYGKPNMTVVQMKFENELKLMRMDLEKEKNKIFDEMNKNQKQSLDLQKTQQQLLESMVNSNSNRNSGNKFESAISQMSKSQENVAKALRENNVEDREEKDYDRVDKQLEEISNTMIPLQEITNKGIETSEKIKKFASRLLSQYETTRKLNQRILRLELDLRKEKSGSKHKATGGSCGGRKSCGVCVQDPNCGWCFSEKKCVQGDSLGPLESNCPFFHFSICSESICNDIDSCEGCSRYSNCEWCGLNNLCMEKGQKICDLPTVTSPEKCSDKGKSSPEKILRGIMKKYNSADIYL